MKKVISVIIICTILFGFFFSKPINISYAADDYTESETLSGVDSESSGDNYNSLMSDGTATVDQGQKDSSGSYTQKKTKEKISVANSWPERFLVSILSIFPFVAHTILNMIAGDNFTIQDLLTSKIEITNIDFWNTSSSTDWINDMRVNVSIWYYSVRNIALIGMLLVLIYTGIRLATIILRGGNPRDQAKYKRLFVNWLVGFALTLIMHYIMIGAIGLTNMIIGIVSDIAKNITNAGDLENQLVNNTWGYIWSANNQHPFWQFVVYCFLVFYQFKFFFAYLLRVLKVYFYVVISPLVCMTYAIDKIKDNRSQALNSWTNEFLSELLMQPIQLITYVIFIASTDAILKIAPVLMIVILMVISKVDKDLRKLLLGNRMGKFNKAPDEIKGPRNKSINPMANMLKPFTGK